MIGAIFTNFAMAFSKEQVAETGFYLTYTLLMTLMMTSFMMTSAIVRDVLHSLTEFMKVLLPDVLYGPDIYNGQSAVRCVL